MKLRPFVLLLILGFSTFFACANDKSSDESVLAILEESELPILRVGLPPFPPFAYPNEDSERGVVVEIFNMLEKELKGKAKVKIIYYPYPRVVESMKRGDLDLAIIFKNKPLGPYVTYIGEVSKSKVIIIPDKGIKIRGYEDLYSIGSIAVLRRANFEPRFDVDAKISKFTVVNYESGFRMMDLGRVGAVVGSQSGLEEVLHNLEFESKRWGEPFVLNNKEWWLHLSNKSPHQALIPDLTKAVEKIYKEDLVWQLFMQSKGKRAIAPTAPTSTPTPSSSSTVPSTP